MLPGLAAATASALLVIAALAITGCTRIAPYVAAGLAAGLSAPPLGPSMRSTWRNLTAGTNLRQPAYSLDSVCEQSLYLVGPVLVGLVLQVADAPAAVVLTAALMLTGTLGMIAAPAAARPAEVDTTRSLRPIDPGPLRHRGFGAVVTSILTTAGGLAVVYGGIAASAERHGQLAAAGYIEAALAAGSVAGGLLWGRRRHGRRRSTHLTGLVLLFATGAALAAAAPGLIQLAAVMAFTGLGIAPLFVVSYLAADELTPEAERTEASAWVNTANNVGAATGAAIGGLVIDRGGPATGFLTAAAMLTGAALFVRLVRHRLDAGATSARRRARSRRSGVTGRPARSARTPSA